METTAKTIKDVGANFIPVKDITDNLDEVSVGHAGIYPVDIDDTEDASVETIEPIILLTVEGGTRQIMLSVEDGLKTFVQDGLASKDQAVLEKYGLSKDMERVKAIPDKITGAIVYYLTRGIEQDFGITWNKTPKSLKSKQERDKKAEKEDNKVPTKAEKNKLLAMRNYTYYEKDIADGVITMEEAVASMMKAAADIKELEKKGFYVSPKKTEGVLLYDYKNEVISSNGREDGFRIYTSNSLIVVIPNVFENYYGLPPEDRPSKISRQIKNTWIKDISSLDNLLEHDWGKMEVSKKEILDNCVIKGTHIVKINKSGMMSDRWLCLDCVDKASGKQVLHMLHGDVHMTINEKEYYSKKKKKNS